MRKQVQTYVDLCKCAAANPHNPRPPLKTRPTPTEPWKVTAVDYKGPIGPQRWYIHTQMCIYSRYPEVYMTKSTRMEELKKVMDKTMRTHGVPDEIWSDGGPPYNGYEWEQYVEDWGSRPKKTTPYHPPANGTVERFNRTLKQAILTAYIENKDPIEEVDKLVASYRNTPHSATKLMFNREVNTKLPRFTTTSRGRHHEKARRNDKMAKLETKRRYDAKHRTRLVEIKPGDWAYIRRTSTSSTKGTWDPIPYQITEVVHNQITGTRQGEEKTRDRYDWKLLVARPAHLQAFRPRTTTIKTPEALKFPENPWGYTDDWDDDDFDQRPVTRAERGRRLQAQSRAATDTQQQHNQTSIEDTAATRQPPTTRQMHTVEEEDETTQDEGPPPPRPPPTPPPPLHRHPTTTGTSAQRATSWSS